MKKLNISWSDKVCNEHRSIEECREERAIISVINRRQRVRLGYTLRHGDLVPLFIERRVIGRRPSGRPGAGILDRVKDDSPYVAVKGCALDREL